MTTFNVVVPEKLWVELFMWCCENRFGYIPFSKPELVTVEQDDDGLFAVRARHVWLPRSREVEFRLRWSDEVFEAPQLR